MAGESGGCILLVRHGETEWNAGARIQGWLDSALTAAGRAQAEAIGRHLRTMREAEGAEMIASPIGRCRHTAEIIRAAMGSLAPPLHFDERLREITLGSWDGLYRRDVAQRVPGIFDGPDVQNWYFRSPDGETYEGFSGRIAAWLTDVAGRRVIAVTHGGVTRVLRGLYGGLHRDVAMALPVPQDRFFHLAEGRIDEITLAGP